MNELRRRGLRLGAAWVALLVLMLSSLGSAYLPLGPWNLVVGVAIATLKSAIVLWLFMGLVRAPATLRLAAALGFATLALLFALSSVDYATRDVHPAPMQQPTQLQSTAKGGL
ncbi:cytochrome C oxidase subunit IV family protein [Ramlibacter sp. MMS24-I3-19]|uniref:cytochrome C oxidase subunit IV family protein n=1 Tax=Ramlibacter sp. MMS24-I3-19 TaxID=3416606 RepID=UPI003D0807F3